MNGASSPGAPRTVSLSLVSHTNVGKTSLARTLLGRDIGEVRDEAHVTLAAEPHLMAETPAGDRLMLWDTPGFGDSLRLAQRFKQVGNPMGWLLTEVWDRWRDRAFWASQHAVRNVLDQADVALYLVNAAEAPEDAAYLGAELQVLALLGKPVIVLLNQLGEPGHPADEARQVQRWRAHFANPDNMPPINPTIIATATKPDTGSGMATGTVLAVLPLDAFARCWVQEGVLLQAVAAAVAPAAHAAMARLSLAWSTRQHGIWQAAMRVLAERLARAGLDHQALVDAGWVASLRAPLRSLGAALGLPQGGPADPQAEAMAALATRLDADIRQGTDALIRLHGLQGQASAEVQALLARHFARREPVSEGRAALWGGVVTGALAGLKADIATGGLTMGGGLLAGGVLGALGAAGAARGVNRIRGLNEPWLAWQDSVLDALMRSALLGYLAVAHHGRGRGDWQRGEPPPAWGDAVDAVLASQQPTLRELWRQREVLLAAAASTPPADSAVGHAGQPGAPASPASAKPPGLEAAGFTQQLQALLSEASAAVLARLYPDAARLAGLPG